MPATGIQRGGRELAARRGSPQARLAAPQARERTRLARGQSGTGRTASPAGRGADAGPLTTAASTTASTPRPACRAGDEPQPLRPSLDGGVPALQRELGAHGRETVRRLLEAGRAEFEEAGFQAARVEDIVKRAKTSHGTFYLYFANKDDLFRTLLRDALVDMANITDEFPVVTSNDAGRAALRSGWRASLTPTPRMRRLSGS